MQIANLKKKIFLPGYLSQNECQCLLTYGTEILCIWVTFLFDGFLVCIKVPRPIVPCSAGVFLSIGAWKGFSSHHYFQVSESSEPFFFLVTTHDYYGMCVNTPSLPQSQTFLVVPLTSTQAHTQPSTQVSTCTTVISDVVLVASQTLLLICAER